MTFDMSNVKYSNEYISKYALIELRMSNAMVN